MVEEADRVRREWREDHTIPCEGLKEIVKFAHQLNSSTAKQELRTERLEEDRKRQNGSLDTIKMQIQNGADDRARQVAELRQFVNVQIADLRQAWNDELKRIYFWLVGLAFGLVVACLLLALNLVIKR